MNCSDSEDSAPTEVTQAEARVQRKTENELRKASTRALKKSRKRKRKRQSEAVNTPAVEQSVEVEAPAISEEVLAEVAQLKE